MASNDQDEELGLYASEELIQQVQQLELQAKRMKDLVAQRRGERSDLELEVTRMERMKKHMEEMAKENLEAAEQDRLEQEKKKPFHGKGNVLGAPSAPDPVISRPRGSKPPPPPVPVDTAQPVSSMQVRSGDGSRIIVKLNHSHKIKHLKQQIASQQPQESRSFVLVTSGMPAKPLNNEEMTIKEADILGAAVLQRFI